MRSTNSPAAEHRAAVANLLLDLPEDAAFSSTSGQAFVSLPRINQTFALSDPLLHDWFRDRYFRNNGQPLNSHTLHHVLATLRARATCHGRRRIVGIRATGAPGSIYIDLCNNDSESVAITKDGWEITKLPEVTFQSTRGQLPIEWHRSPDLCVRELTDSSSHADPLYPAIQTLVQSKIEWTGTATDLLNEICVTAPVTCTTARALSQR
jgi:hypothetical protein